MTIALLGPGGVGGFIGAALARVCEDVVIVARESTADVIAGSGIEVSSVALGNFRAWPSAVAMLDRAVDVVIVATKATGLTAALDRVAAAPAVVVPLLNGIDHMAVLRERFGQSRVVAGVIRIESDRPAAGKIIQTSPSVRVDLASDEARLAPTVERLATLFQGAQIPVEIGRSESQILWSKLVRLNALACTTSASDRSIGFIRTNPEWRAVLVACIEETAAVANADGANIDAAARLVELDEAHPELGSSMQRDIAAGREPELDAIPGAVLRAAARHGVECPTVAQLKKTIEERIAAG